MNLFFFLSFLKNWEISYFKCALFIREHKDHLGLLALLVCLVSRDNLVTTVALVMPALLASRARQDWKDRRVIKVTKDPRVPSAKQVLWVRQEIVACPDFQDLSALLALEDYEDRR